MIRNEDVRRLGETGGVYRVMLRSLEVKSCTWAVDFVETTKYDTLSTRKSYEGRLHGDRSRASK